MAPFKKNSILLLLCSPSPKFLPYHKYSSQIFEVSLAKFFGTNCHNLPILLSLRLLTKLIKCPLDFILVQSYAVPSGGRLPGIFIATKWFYFSRKKNKTFSPKQKGQNVADNCFWITKFKKQVSPTEKRKQEGNLLYTEKKF